MSLVMDERHAQAAHERRAEQIRDLLPPDSASGKAAGRTMRWRDPPRWALAALAAVAWLLRYAIQFGLHLASPPPWAQAFDQSRYIASAQAFAHGQLSAASHWYPLGYPLLAAPFARILPHEPFFVPDLALFVASVLAFAAVMRRLRVGGTAATLLFLLGDLVIGKHAELWTRPWTTDLSAPLLWGLIAQTLHVAEPRTDAAPPRARAMLLLGLLAGALPLVRPADAVPALLALLFAGVALARQRRLRVAGLVATLGGGLALCVPYALLHLAIYGAHASDYARAAASQGFAFADLPWKAYVVLVTPMPWFPLGVSLVELMPWALPGIAGLALAGWSGDARARRALALVALLAIPYLLLALSYTDLQPPGLWRFKNAHYFKWLFPLLAVGFWLWLRALRGGAPRALGALALVLLPTLLRPLPVAVPDSVPARMLMFRGATDRDWNAAYFAPATITDARGNMENVGRFHQVPDAYGARALAVSRLFEGPAVRRDPQEAPRYRAAQQPYARYAVRLSVGVPCWLRLQAACRMPPPPR